MKSAAAVLLVVGSFVASQPAFAATTDDVKWINQCVADNKDQGVKESVVLAYCTCMNNKMDDNETKSITQWEKTHETERRACDRESGWK